MLWWNRLKRWVAPGLRFFSGGRSRSLLRPRFGRRVRLDTGARQVERSVTRDLIQLAWPIAAGMLGETALGLVDTKLVGGLGAAQLGGVGMANMLFFLGYSLVFAPNASPGLAPAPRAAERRRPASRPGRFPPGGDGARRAPHAG
jgi:hypothetical protein